ncbi:MAG: SMP-30/gluconolactonase/LRE family protein [Beijerinckiaceae bacterium]|jgi:sugar lactone lactonase YvrE|nr:SMP-30/gluconolactonase/LRE family protein [Beijerinckiaceae bacterium]
MPTPIQLDEVTFRGSGLSRPECLVTHESGWLFAADWQGAGGVACIAPDGGVTRITARRPADDPLRPNGIALEPGGTFLVAHLGADTGGVFRLHPDGACAPVLLELDGKVLPPSNFPLLDRKGRIWLTISTRMVPRALDYRPEAHSGFIVLIEEGRARIVADGLGYTNECALSPDERFLFVNETFARRLTRFSVLDDGSLVDRTTVTTFGAGTFPDGVALDEAGDFWITSIISNRVIHVRGDGTQRIILEEADDAHLTAVEPAFLHGSMGRAHLDGSPARCLRNVSSLSFGGPTLREAYLGCLLGERIAQFTAPVRGLALPSHTMPLGTLARQVSR